MLNRRISMLIVAVLIAISGSAVKANDRQNLNLLIQYYSDYYDVPESLVHRVVKRESTYNANARNGSYYGLMQISPATARGMGFRGNPQDLLDPETNLIYAVKYLRGAYLVAGGNHDRSVRLYAAGYYYDAKAKGLLEETGLRPGPKSPVAPTPPTAQTRIAAPATPPERIAFAAPVVASTTPQAATPAAPAVIAAPQALGFLPPQRPIVENNSALQAINTVQGPVLTPPTPSRPAGLSNFIAEPLVETVEGLRPSASFFDGTFLALEQVNTAQ